MASAVAFDDLADTPTVRMADAPHSQPAQAMPGQLPKRAFSWRSLTAGAKVPWLASLLVFVFTAALTFTAVYVHALESVGGPQMPHFLEVLLPESGLGLHIEYQGQHLLVGWNRRSALVQAASEGTLRIEDGPERRELHLDKAQLAAGAILYKPSSEDVTFRLEVQGDQSRPVVESMRVLDKGAARPAVSTAPVVSSPPAVSPAPASAAPAKRIAKPDSEPDASEPQPAATDTKPPADTTSSRPPSSEPATRQLAQAPSYVPPVSTPPSAQLTTSPIPDAPAVTTAQAPALDVQPLSAKQNPPLAQAPGENSQTKTSAPSTPADAKTISSFRPARPLRQVMPEAPLLGPAYVYKPTEIQIVVDIDKTGHVKTARLVRDRSKISDGLAGVSLVAARQWVFEPATLHGRPVESQHLILFQFRPASMR